MGEMNSIVAVLCVAVAVQANIPQYVVDIIDKPGAQYTLYKGYINKLKLREGKEEEVFKGLNIGFTSEVIGDKCLDLFYWHAKVKFAKKRFFSLLGSANPDTGIVESDLKMPLEEPHIKVALIGCNYFGSDNLRQLCYADQLLTYAALFLGRNNVKKFYNSLNSDPTVAITREMLGHIELPTREKVGKDLDILYEELGGNNNNGITQKEFEEYVIQESIADDFRVCRQSVDLETGEGDFDSACLQRELVEYVNDDLTEMDIAVLFRAVDKNNDGEITWEDINGLDNNKFTEEKAKQIIILLDMTATVPTEEPKLDYGEFRSYVRSPTVLVQLERVCTEQHKNQKEEIDCLIETFKKLCDEGHDPIWLGVPNLDQLIIFEIFVAEKNGEINPRDLTKYGKFSTEQTVARFINEADNGGDEKVNLEEFNEYVNIPHMVYGTAECLLKNRKEPNTREECFINQISETIDNFNFLEKTAWNHWFDHYDTDKNGKIDLLDDLDSQLSHPGLGALFVKELGQGGSAVSPFEFTWYVKQKDLAGRYKTNKIISELTENLNIDQIKNLNNELVKWIEGGFTEYDIQQFFDLLLKKLEDRWFGPELYKEDFDKYVWTKVAPVIRQIDAIETDVEISIHFIEFWVWLHSPNVGDTNKGPRIKDIFEKDCTERKKSQKDELNCYYEISREWSKFGITQAQVTEAQAAEEKKAEEKKAEEKKAEETKTEEAKTK